MTNRAGFCVGGRFSKMQDLTEKLCARISRDGPLSFRDVMHAALYDEEFGYYTRGARIGKSGADFLTASQLHPLFGATLARVAAQYLGETGAATPLVWEIGAGAGALAAAILKWIPRREDGRYVISETSAAMAARQRSALSAFQGQVSWLPMESVEKLSGVALAVEVFDALPVHRLSWRKNHWREEFVDCNSGVLRSIWVECAHPALGELAGSLQLALGETQVVEINLDAANLLKQISDRLERGFLIVFDYGDETHRLFTKSRPNGTVRRFSGHTVTGDYLERPGEADLTASVDFGSLRRFAQNTGFELVEFETQARWLVRHGIADIAAEMDQSSSTLVAKTKVRQALKELTLPGGISENFKVMVLRTGAVPSCAERSAS